MGIEVGIATQRHRLLRLVAGLLLAVGFVSLTPFSSSCRRWVRETVFSILTRAEAAAQALVIAQAAVLAGRRGLRFDPAVLFAPLEKSAPEALPADFALPTFEELRQRIIA